MHDTELYFCPFPVQYFYQQPYEGMERTVIKFANHTKLKVGVNVLDDRIKIQNDLDKAEHWDESHKMKLTDMLWIKK